VKALLAPFLPLSNFCKDCLRALEKERRPEWNWMYELSRMPPLGRFVKDYGFQPDYPVLLMFDEFVMDAEAFDQMQNQPQGWMGDWPEVVEILHSEGSLAVVDMRTLQKRASRTRSAMLSHDIRDLGRWSKAFEIYEATMADASKAFAGKPPGTESFAFNVDWNRKHWVGGSDHQGHDPAALLLQPVDDLDPVHRQAREDVSSAIRSHLQEVNAVISVAARVDAAPMFWAPYSGYAAEKVVEHGDGDAAQLFFEVGFPMFRPETGREFQRLRSDPRIEDLRAEIIMAFKSGQLVDQNYATSTLLEALRIQDEMGPIRKILAYVSQVIGMVPYLGVPASLAADRIASAIEADKGDRMSWFYLISNGLGQS
jgi:hypothetical protein